MNWRHHLVKATLATFVSLICLISASCGARTGPGGTYVLDGGAFAQAMGEQIRHQLGLMTPDQQEATMQTLESTVFDLTLRDDHTFIAQQKIGPKQAEYRGTWTLEGQEFHLRQTHENGQLVEDSMFGTLIGTQIRVTDEDQGRMVELVLNRE
jgi:hypothetical protein